MKLIFYLRALIATPIAVFLTAAAGSMIVVCGGVLQNQKIVDHILYFWGSSIIFIFNIHVVLKGEESVPQGGCVFLFNHSSNFDIMAFHAAIRKPARFGAKAELFKIPIFGHGMRASGGLEIVRNEKGRVLQLYKNSIQRVLNGESFILAAEGTRQSVPGVGARFKAGPFIFAISGQFPIVPVVIRGAAECLAKGQFWACTDKWRHEILIQVLPPISTKGLTIENRQALQLQSQNLMTSAYKNG